MGNAMTKRWISDAKQRRSKRYVELHAQLRREVEQQPKRRALPAKSEKQSRHIARSEFYRNFGETP